MSPHDLSCAADMLRSARHVVAFTGAGISAESGIPTFRDDGGFWQEFPPEEFAHWGGLLKVAALHPRRLADFLLAVLEPLAIARPNAAHQVLADLERHLNVTVITQNIDGLHQAAGSTIVKEIHGAMFEIVSAASGRFDRLVSQNDLRRVVERIRASVKGPLTAPRLALAIRPIFGLGSSGMHRPNLVLFGDALNEPAWSDALNAARNCDVMLAIGTSGVVQPAAMLPIEAASAGATIITIDPVESPGDIWLQGSATQILPALLESAFAS